MSDFKRKHFKGDIISGCVRWYRKYGIRYREWEEMMTEHGFEADHTTFCRWVQRYALKIEKCLRFYYRPCLGESWRVDEICVKVKGKWKYPYRAITQSGKTPVFYLLSTRNAKAAKRFPGQILHQMKGYEKPDTITIQTGLWLIIRRFAAWGRRPLK